MQFGHNFLHNMLDMTPPTWYRKQCF